MLIADDLEAGSGLTPADGVVPTSLTVKVAVQDPTIADSRPDERDWPTLTLEHELTVDDYVAFAMCVVPQSTRIRRRRLYYPVKVGVLTLLVVAAIMTILTRNVIVSVVLALVLGIAYSLIAILTWRQNLRRNLTVLAKERGVVDLGLQRLTINDDGLHETCGFFETLMRWPGIGRIEQTPDHAFILVGPQRGYIVPRRGREAEVESFLAEVRSRCAACDNPEWGA